MHGKLPIVVRRMEQLLQKLLQQPGPQRTPAASR
jgi:hypothetical protein